MALSVLLHLLLILSAIQREKGGIKAENIERGIEVTLTQLPKSETQLPKPKLEPQPTRPSKPKAKPRQTPRIHPKPVLRPHAPRPSPTAKPQKQRAVKPEPLPDFKDDFAELAKDYAREAGSIPSPGKASSAPDTGIHPGAILNINPRINYPRQALLKGWQGRVVVLIHIGADGHTQDVELLQSSGHEELDNEVLGAVQHWRFRPPMRGNTPVEGTYKHTVIFGADEEVIDDFKTHWQEIRLMPAGG